MVEFQKLDSGVCRSGEGRLGRYGLCKLHNEAKLRVLLSRTILMFCRILRFFSEHTSVKRNIERVMSSHLRTSRLFDDLGRPLKHEYSREDT